MNRRIKIILMSIFIIYMVDYLKLGDNIMTQLKQGIIIMMAFWFSFIKENNDMGNHIDSVLLLIIFLINLFGIITSLYGVNPITSLSTLIGYNIYFYLFYKISGELSKSDRNIVDFNNILIIVSIIITVLALVIKPSLTVNQFLSFDQFGRNRVYGLFAGPNYLGAIAYVSIIACIINLKFNNGFNKITYIFLSAYFTLLLIISKSRTAFYSLIVFLIIYGFYFIFSKIKNINLRLSISIILILVFIVTGYSISKVILQMPIDTLTTMTTGRVENWKTLYKVATLNKFNFFFGFGFRAVTSGIVPGVPINPDNGQINTDNGYLVTLCESGVIGLFLILGIIAYLISKLLCKTSNEVNVIILSLLVSFCIYVFFETFLMNFGHIVSLYCWIICFWGIQRNRKMSVCSIKSYDFRRIKEINL